MLHLSNHKKERKMSSSISKRQFLPEQVTDLHHTKSQFCTSIKKKSEAYYLIKYQGLTLHLPAIQSLLTPLVSAWLSTLKPPAFSTTSMHAWKTCASTCRHRLKYPTPALGGRSRKSNLKNVQARLSSERWWKLWLAVLGDFWRADLLDAILRAVTVVCS